MPLSSSYKTGARPKRACETEIPIKQLLEWMNDIFCVSAKKHFEGEILRNINILKTKNCDSGPSPAVDKGCRGMILSYSRRGRTDGRIYLLISPTDNTTLIMQATLLEITAINAAGVFFVLPARFD